MIESAAHVGRRQAVAKTSLVIPFFLGEAMDIHTILVPTDYSASSMQAIDVAKSLAREHRAKIVLLHILEPVPEAGAGLLAYSFEDSHVEEARLKLEEIDGDPAIVVERKLLRGVVVDQILQTASELHADIIVMGTHGRRWLTHLLMGSVAEGVVRRAECPVLTVKKQKPAPEHPKGAGVAYSQPPIP